MEKVFVPASVPPEKRKEYLKNWKVATRGTGRLMMFACDQKVEHLNDDFVGPGIPAEVADPKHYFNIACGAEIGVLAAQAGLLSRYANDLCRNTPLIVKINSKTNLIKKEERDPFSNRWLAMEDIVNFKKTSGLNIVGVGYTVYIGSTFESESFGQAARVIYKAHQEGMLAVIWIYARGKAVKNEEDIHLLAGGAGVAVCLDTDFVKISYPYSQPTIETAKKFREVTTAAGRSGVICIGGKKMPEKKFLEQLHHQIHISGTRGVAVGRNIYQRPLNEAVRMANAISAVTLYDYSAEEAYKIYQGKKKLTIKKPTLPKEKISLKSFLSFSF
ncbi:MAG: aldolase [Patescibacteria group bacterium]|jgi:fructose-bisphosphate aldolase/6-deoxy-5-ketofructose 1-phosphate synthase